MALRRMSIVLTILSLATGIALSPCGCGKKDSEATLKALAAARDISFGSYYNFDRRGEAHDRVFETEMKVMTVGAFWKNVLRNGPTSSDFDFAETDATVNWGRQRNMYLYGQTLVWFEDIPDWLEATPTADVEGVMNGTLPRLTTNSKNRPTRRLLRPSWPRAGTKF